MSLNGRLATLDLWSIVQMLSASGASGRLTLVRPDRHALVLLRAGRIAYVAVGPGGETLAGLLQRGGLVTEEELIGALERQNEAAERKKIGDVLVEMNLISREALREVVLQHTQRLLAELLAWKDGFFRFEPDSEDPTTAVDYELGDFAVPEDLAPQELLMRAVTTLGHGDPTALPPLPEPPSPPPAAPLSPPPPSPTSSFAPDYTGEVVLSLLRFAAQILNRAVVFLIERGVARGVGEFGLQTPGRSPAEVVREMELPLREPSVIRLAVEHRRIYHGPLEPTRWNLHLIEELGGAEPREAVAIPLIVADEVLLVLYGDNAHEGKPIGPLDALEATAARSARILERTIASQKRRT